MKAIKLQLEIVKSMLVENETKWNNASLVKASDLGSFITSGTIQSELIEPIAVAMSNMPFFANIGGGFGRQSVGKMPIVKGTVKGGGIARAPESGNAAISGANIGVKSNSGVNRPGSLATEETRNSQLALPAGNVPSGSSLVIEHSPNPKVKFSDSELRAANYMYEQGNKVVLRHPVGTRADGGMSDLLEKHLTLMISSFYLRGRRRYAQDYLQLRKYIKPSRYPMQNTIQLYF